MPDHPLHDMPTTDNHPYGDGGRLDGSPDGPLEATVGPIPNKKWSVLERISWGLEALLLLSLFIGWGVLSGRMLAFIGILFGPALFVIILGYPADLILVTIMAIKKRLSRRAKMAKVVFLISVPIITGWLFLLLAAAEGAS